MPFIDAGFVDSSISANNIVPFVTGTSPSDTGAKVGTNTRIYCSDYCATPFYSSRINYNSQNQPVVLINNYQHSNTQVCTFHGGLTRIGRLNFQGGRPADLTLGNGACVFINNALLGDITVKENSLLFFGSNYRFTGTVNVTSGGRIRDASDFNANDISFIDRGQLCWNLWDSGPWGSMSLMNYCKNV